MKKIPWGCSPATPFCTSISWPQFFSSVLVFRPVLIFQYAMSTAARTSPVAKYMAMVYRDEPAPLLCPAPPTRSTQQKVPDSDDAHQQQRDTHWHRTHPYKNLLQSFNTPCTSFLCRSMLRISALPAMHAKCRTVFRPNVLLVSCTWGWLSRQLHTEIQKRGLWQPVARAQIVGPKLCVPTKTKPGRTVWTDRLVV